MLHVKIVITFQLHKIQCITLQLLPIIINIQYHKHLLGIFMNTFDQRQIVTNKIFFPKTLNNEPNKQSLCKRTGESQINETTNLG